MAVMPKVLVVDDAATVRMYHRAILEAGGFAVEEAANGLEGLEKALSTAFDLVLVDVNMPKMDGYSLVRALRGQPSTASLPAILISTEAEAADARQGYAAGANLYLVKPVRPDDLTLNARMLTAHLAR
jgi:two-component system, chemotaxis family, chemotaxis protein CheY